MKNRMIFNESGLRALSIIVVSCYPVHHELSAEVKTYIGKVVAGEVTMDCEFLLSKIPALVQSIVDFSRKEKKSIIDAVTVWEFFAGNVHYEKILLDFEENKLHIMPRSVYSLRTMFAHLILPVEIVGHQADGFVGKYKYGQFDFIVRGLASLKSDEELLRENLSKKISTIVLIHFATIVDVKPSKGLILKIVNLQKYTDVFQMACRYLQKNNGVDYNTYPSNCRAKTQHAFENISL